MFSSVKGFLGFTVGVGLTLGLLLTPHLVPGGWGYRAAWAWTPFQTVAAGGGALAVLATSLWIGGRLVRGAGSWREPKVIAAALLIAGVANTLYMFLIEGYGLLNGWRGLIAVLGVPVIYGNLVRVLGKVSLREAMASILTGALATMGAGFILAALVRGW
jgi:hypothetical protein